jgi:hypothetical protein
LNNVLCLLHIPDSHVVECCFHVCSFLFSWEDLLLLLLLCVDYIRAILRESLWLCLYFNHLLILS